MSTSSNYWINRIEADRKAARRAAISARFENVFDLANDKTWAAILVIVWAIGTLAIIHQTLAYGWTMLLTFLVMEGAFTTLVAAVWKRSK